jgi:transcriptional regulator with XRE-family HTH domain
MKREQAAFAERLHHLLAVAQIDSRPANLVRLLARYGKVAVTQQAISGWLNGKHLPKPAAIRALAHILGVEPHVLQYGENSASRIGEPRTAWPEHLNGRDRLLFEEILTLLREPRELVHLFVGTLAAALREPRQDGARSIQTQGA